MRTVTIGFSKEEIDKFQTSEMDFTPETEIYVRALTRKENRSIGKVIDKDSTELEFQYHVFSLLFDTRFMDMLDNCPSEDSRRLFRAIWDETHGSKEEEKNLRSSGDGTTTGTEQNTAKGAEAQKQKEE